MSLFRINDLWVACYFLHATVTQKKISQVDLLETVTQTCSAEKETLAQVFSCEFCELFENTFFQRTSPVVVSNLSCYYYWH